MVFHSSTITMMHGPINIRSELLVCAWGTLTCFRRVRKAAVNCVMSVCRYRWKDSNSTGWNIVTFHARSRLHSQISFNITQEYQTLCVKRTYNNVTGLYNGDSVLCEVRTGAEKSLCELKLTICCCDGVVK